jgi:hypothetical protein
LNLTFALVGLLRGALGDGRLRRLVANPVPVGIRLQRGANVDSPRRLRGVVVGVDGAEIKQRSLLPLGTVLRATGVDGDAVVPPGDDQQTKGVAALDGDARREGIKRTRLRQVGGQFEIEYWTRGQQGWSRTRRVTHNSGELNVRPYAVNGGVAWMRGRYDGFQNYATRLVWRPVSNGIGEGGVGDRLRLISD